MRLNCAISEYTSASALVRKPILISFMLLYRKLLSQALLLLKQLTIAHVRVSCDSLCFLRFILPIKLIHIAHDCEVVSVNSNDSRKGTSIWAKRVKYSTQICKCQCASLAGEAIGDRKIMIIRQSWKLPFMTRSNSISLLQRRQNQSQQLNYVIISCRYLSTLRTFNGLIGLPQFECSKSITCKQRVHLSNYVMDVIMQNMI